MSSKKQNNPPSAIAWDLASQLFEEALEIPAAERSAFLDTATHDQPELREEIESLLKAHEKAESFLENPVGPKMVEALDQMDRPPRLMLDGQIDDYRVEAPLGYGGFATVYLAHQISLDRKVALKVSRNFGQEARTMAQLDHNDIVKVFSQTIDGKRDLRLVAMQFVPGTSLEKLTEALQTRGRRLPPPSDILEIIDLHTNAPVLLNSQALADRDRLKGFDFIDTVLWFGIRVSGALAYAHEKGVLHLDVKPSNLLVTPYGLPLLTDFNVSLDTRTLTQPLLLGGTAQYMAPEQREALKSHNPGASVAALDARTDLYSLGIVLREFLTSGGWTPEDDRASVGIILDRATAEKPEDRYPNANRLKSVLEGAQEMRSIRRTLPPPDALIRMAEKRPVLTLTLVCILIPQILGSLINITYNSLQIVSQLTPEQQAAFRKLLIAYNLAVYPVGLTICVVLILRLSRCLRKPASGFTDPLRLARDRKRVLAFPVWLFTVTLFGWLPGTLFFPVGIQRIAGSLPWEFYGHFAISFVLSWLVATSYSCLYTELVCLRVLYPLFFQECAQIRTTAARELAPVGPRVRIFRWMTGFVPLAGAALLIFLGPDKFDAGHYQFFRVLVSCLIGIGMLGMRLADFTTQMLQQTVYALTGNERLLARDAGAAA